MADLTDLEALPLDQLVAQYEATITELLALDAVPARRDDLAHEQKLDVLYLRAGEFSRELNRRTRYQPAGEGAAP